MKSTNYIAIGLLSLRRANDNFIQILEVIREYLVEEFSYIGPTFSTSITVLGPQGSPGTPPVVVS